MDSITKAILDIMFSSPNPNDDYDEMLEHYGTKRHSGRFPWGSGDDPYQHEADFLSRVDILKKEGYSDTQIARDMGLSTTEYRLEYSICKTNQRAYKVQQAKALKEKGYSNPKIAEEMGLPNESSVRSLLNEHSETKMNQARVAADVLKEAVDSKGMIDIGAGVEKDLGVSRTKMNEALYLLKREGYEVYGGGVAQVTNKGRQTNMQVLCPPGTEHKEIFDLENVHSLTDYKVVQDNEGNDVMVPKKFQYPTSIDGKRVYIRYAEDGGIDRDGTIELRRNVEDLSLGQSRYSQVRILVDDSMYLKGMAHYSDNIPEGYDIVFNTNKKRGTPPEKVFKPIKDDPNNPFGANIKQNGGQSYYFDKNGVKHLSAINKRSDEGDWGDWDDTLPAQFLSKQDPKLISKQLDLNVQYKREEYNSIMAIKNPTVRRQMLNTFASDCDSTALHLDAAALPRQKWHVILPDPNLKDNEVYAPQYKNGEQVALVRYPHAGTFEIPILTVNNKRKTSAEIIGADSSDAVCINAKVAERLSGADFDGDTVMVIPTHDPYGNVKIKSKPPLKGLEGYDPKHEYYTEPTVTYDASGKKIETYPYKTMSKGSIQKEMGVVSNLITDMTLKGATDDELAAVTRHSMTVIDAYKHHLDYKQSEVDNNIAYLKQKYQGHIGPDGRYHEGSGTIVSRAKSQTSVNERAGQPHINIKGSKWYDPTRPEGAILYQESGRTKKTVLKDGTVKEELKKVRSTKMMETDDAMTLVSDKHNEVEVMYANYANTMKNMANEARKAAILTPNLKYSREAAKKYAPQVQSLNAKLDACESNAPKEREAQRIANNIVNAQKMSNPGMTTKEIKKASQVALTEARGRVGASRQTIDVTREEWEAIDAGAVTDSKLTKILKYSDSKQIREYTMPTETTKVPEVKVNKMKMLQNNNYTLAEIAEATGCSVSTVKKYLQGK